MVRWFVAACVLGMGVGCTPDNSPVMQPGVDCMTCHCTGDSSCRASSLPWTAAGTIFSAYDSPASGGVQGVHVMILDALDAGVNLTTNEAGNFYTAERLTPPLRVSIEYQGSDAGMLTQPTPSMIYGADAAGKGVGCNGCHQPPDPTTCTNGNTIPIPPNPPGGGAGIAPLGRVAVPGAPFPACPGS